MVKLEFVVKKMEERFVGGKFRPFRCVFVKANKRAETGGEVVELETASLVFLDMKARTARVQTSRYEHPIIIHLDLILTFNNEDVA